MNKQDGLNGIRFPMFMDDTTFNTLTSNATIQSEDVTFGTLIIPTDKLTGTLDVNTALAKNLVTYGYNEKDEFVNVWTECTDEDYPDCMQGYAYIHSIPDTSLDRNLTAVGYYTVDGGESYVYTQPIERHVSYVADAAIKSGDYSEAQMLKLEDFLASYTVKFDVDSEITTQQVKYGKTLSFPEVSVPMGRTLNWFERVGGTDEPIWSEQELDMSQESLTVKKDGEYTIFSKVYDIEKTGEPSHIDLVTKTITRGFSDNDFLALSTSTWNPFTIEIYPELDEKSKKKISKLIKDDIKLILQDRETKKLLKKISEEKSK